MADNPKIRGPADRLRINVNQAHELRYWTGALKCNAEELRAAVKAVGVMAKDVRVHLARKRKA